MPLMWASASIWHCRFSAQVREYKYYIVQHGELDTAAMQQAAAHFVGEHDFRSFCKVDAQHVSTFCRTILDFRQGPSRYIFYWMM